MDELIRKPFWPRSGQLLPQTLQFGDAYGETTVAQSFRALAGEAWGVERLRVDARALSQGTLHVPEIEGRFRSGCSFSAAGDTLTRPLPRGREVVDVYVALARTSCEAPNVTDDPRDHAAVRHVRCRRGEGTELRPLLKLLYDAEGSETHERMPVARVSLVAQEPFLETSFVPPMLRVWSGSAVADVTSEVVRALRDRQRDLLAARATRPLDLRTLPVESLPSLTLLSALNESLAILHHADRSQDLRPAELHGVMVALLGRLEALDGRPPTPHIPYVHDAPGPSFRTLCESLVGIIPTVVRDLHHAFPMTRVDGATFSLAIADPALLVRQVYLSASGVDEQTLAVLSAFAKVASGGRLPTLLNTATRGVPVALDFDPPAPLPSSSRSCTFRLDTRSAYWSEILEHRTLHVHVPQAPSGLRLCLYALPQERR